MIRTHRLLSTLTVLTFLAGCATAAKVNYQHDPTANFSGLKTYSWASMEPLKTEDPRVDPTKVDARIRQAIDSELAVKGYQKVNSGGDFQVLYHAAVEHKIDTQRQDIYADAGEFGRSWMGWEDVTTEFDVGSLVLDILDPKSEKLIWRSSANKTIDLEASEAEKDARVHGAVHDMLANFPPK